MTRYTFIESSSPRGVNRILAALLVLSLLLNVYLLFFRGDEREEPGEDTGVSGKADGDPAAAEDGHGEAADAVPEPTPTAIGEFTDLQAIDVQVSGSLSQTVDREIPGRRGVWVTATASRVLVWSMDMQKDLRKGDRLRALFQPEGEEEVRLAALTYDSQKHRQRFRAYYMVPEGDHWGSYFDADGREVPARLTDKVIEDYEQITALLGDGRNHKGVDFMAPTGTPVYSPRAATVLRTTWNFKYNGNSLELRFDDGIIARYLHLERVAEGLEPGSKVEAGQQVGTSGNTGRTNAPHLHYELARGKRILDPMEVHATEHRQLEGAELERLQELVELYERAMDAAAPSGEDAAPSTAGTGEVESPEADGTAPPA